MYQKSATGAAPDPAWVEEQCAKFETVLSGFTTEMRSHFRRKAAEGRHSWENLENCAGMHNELLAHAIAIPLAANHEAHCANFLAFLWMHRTQQ